MFNLPGALAVCSREYVNVQTVHALKVSTSPAGTVKGCSPSEQPPTSVSNCTADLASMGMQPRISRPPRRPYLTTCTVPLPRSLLPAGACHVAGLQAPAQREPRHVDCLLQLPRLLLLASFRLGHSWLQPRRAQLVVGWQCACGSWWITRPTERFKFAHMLCLQTCYDIPCRLQGCPALAAGAATPASTCTCRVPSLGIGQHSTRALPCAACLGLAVRIDARPAPFTQLQLLPERGAAQPDGGHRGGCEVLGHHW